MQTREHEKRRWERNLEKWSCFDRLDPDTVQVGAPIYGVTHDQPGMALTTHPGRIRFAARLSPGLRVPFAYHPLLEKKMRYVYLALIVFITLAVVTFKVQNIDTVTVSFLSASLTLPVSILIVGVYFIGMLTGGMVMSLIRSWVHGATRPLPRHR